MMQEMVAAKVITGSAYEDLVTGGFAPGYTFRCHACDVSYRLFYRSFGGPRRSPSRRRKFPRSNHASKILTLRIPIESG